MHFMLFLYITVTCLKLIMGDNTGSLPIPKYPFVTENERAEFTQNQYPEATNLLQEYDFIIVGAGSAGCVLANRLSEISEWKILLIEAGGYETLDMGIPALPAYLQGTEIDWQYLTEPSNNAGQGLIDNKFNFPRGKVLGGSSVLNFMIYTRGNRADYDRWEKDFHNPHWSWSEVEIYFKKLENYSVVNKPNNNYFGTNGPMYVNESTYRTSLSDAILKAAEQSGLKSLNINGPDQYGVSHMQDTVKNGFRFSTNRGYLMPIRNLRPNLHLKTNCQVTKILIDNKKAYGINFICNNNSEIFTVHSTKEVILSAGAINSPQLLMLSGIGPETHLRNIGIPLIKNLPVGENLMDHIMMSGLQFLLDKPVYPSEDIALFQTEKSGPLTLPGACEVYAFSHPREDDTLDIEQLFVSSLLTKTISEKFRLNKEIIDTIVTPYNATTGFNVFSLLQKPKSRGYIRLSDRNPLSKIKIYPNYLSHPEDIETLLSGIKDVIKIAKEPALQEWNARILDVPVPSCAKYELFSDEYFKCQIRTTTSTLYHQSGTCKMGPKSDPTTVVDAELKVHGIANLRVVDASIMPEIITGHLNGPVIMIAEKAADLIKFYWNVQC